MADATAHTWYSSFPPATFVCNQPLTFKTYIMLTRLQKKNWKCYNIWAHKTCVMCHLAQFHDLETMHLLFHCGYTRLFPQMLEYLCLIHSLSRWYKLFLNNFLWIKKRENAVYFITDKTVYHPELCCLAAGFYSETKVSSLVSTWYRKSGSLSLI